MLPTPRDLVFTEKLKLSFLVSQMSMRVKEKAGLFTDIFSMIVENSQHQKVHLSYPFSHPMMKIEIK